MLRKTLSLAVLAFFVALAMGTAAWAAASPTDLAVQTSLQEKLAKKYPDVRVTVDDRAATLTGTVQKYLDKVDAEKKARKYTALVHVTNRIAVAGPVVSDAELQAKLSKMLSADRPFQGNVFDAYFIAVKDGVVTLGGYAHNQFARDSALGIVESEKGVKGVVSSVEILPLSTFDDRIRVMAARRIYSQPGLQKYAMDPQHPIRIIVNNGHVDLQGIVLSPMDKTMAFMAANQVPGVFSVTDHLQIAGRPAIGD